MSDIETTLEKYADDSEVHVQYFDARGLSLQIQVASEGNEIWDMTAENVVHLDMPPSLTLGKIEFGKLDLLTDTYMQERNFDYGGEINNYRVIKFTDNDGKKGIVVLYGHEAFFNSSV